LFSLLVATKHNLWSRKHTLWSRMQLSEGQLLDWDINRDAYFFFLTFKVFGLYYLKY
jgi:hypothetical protein